MKSLIDKFETIPLKYFFGLILVLVLLFHFRTPLSKIYFNIQSKNELVGVWELQNDNLSYIKEVHIFNNDNTGTSTHNYKDSSMSFSTRWMIQENILSIIYNDVRPSTYVYEYEIVNNKLFLKTMGNLNIKEKVLIKQY